MGNKQKHQNQHNQQPFKPEATRPGRRSSPPSEFILRSSSNKNAMRDSRVVGWVWLNNAKYWYLFILPHDLFLSVLFSMFFCFVAYFVS